MVFIEVLKYVLPSVIVFLTAYFLIKQQFQREIELKNQDIQSHTKDKTNQVLLPIKLQAYERMTLFLERIHPNQLIIKHNKPNYNSTQLQSILIRSIREEFEHNLSQQLYLSETAWQKVSKAKEECIKQINFAASKLNSEAKSNELGSIIIQQYSQLSPQPIQEAIKQLKLDIQKGL